MNEIQGAILWISVIQLVMFLYILFANYCQNSDICELENYIINHEHAVPEPGPIDKRYDDFREHSDKIKILEESWFESHPCVYRKPKSICTGTHGYSFVYENVLTCHYPSPEGGTKWEKDMLSYCSKCKVRKEPDKVD